MFNNTDGEGLPADGGKTEPKAEDRKHASNCGVVASIGGGACSRGAGRFYLGVQIECLSCDKVGEVAGLPIEWMQGVCLKNSWRATLIQAYPAWLQA